MTDAEGTAVHTLHRLGVRVEALTVEADKVEISCTGCTADGRGMTGWIPSRALRAPGGAGNKRDPLAVGLLHRATWAGGQGLAPDVTNDDACMLIDHGFVFDRQGQANWRAGGGEIKMVQRADGAWIVTEFIGPTPVNPTEVEALWTCRVQGGATPPPRPRPAEEE